MYATLSRFIRDDSGATALEYGLIAGLIATVMVTATKTLGGKLTNTFTNLSNKM
jgi:pilus assembly protein Flp/PilA